MLERMNKKALFLFADGVEELELIAPVDVLRRAGVEVTMATLGDGMHVLTRGGITLHADALLSEVTVADFDIIVVPGGPGVIELRKQGTLASTLKAFAPSGKPIAAICAAPLLLHDAGLLQDKRFTSHDSCWQELPLSLPKDAVVIDGSIITSQGAGTALSFGLTLVEVLVGAEVRKQVEKAIMLPA